MTAMNIAQIRREFKQFVLDNSLPESVFRERCHQDRDDVCGGRGNTCAPEDAAENWDKLLEQFCEENGYNYSDIAPIPSSWKTELEADLPR